MKITVLAGGLSPERDVSLATGSLVSNALIEKGNDVLLCDLYKGIDADPSEIDSLFINKNSDKRYDYQIRESAPDLKKLIESNGNRSQFIGKHVIDACQAADIVFIALHGGSGENGQLQSTLDGYGIKYTGSGFLGSALAMDKELTKCLLRFSGIYTPDWVSIDAKKHDYDIDKIEAEIGYPCFIKPSNCGSSIGVSCVSSRSQLIKALQLAEQYESNILIEKKIFGREFTIGVLDGKALPALEIIPLEGFYNYKNKYQPNLTKEICPAEIDDSLARKLQDYAEKAYGLLRQEGYSRIDFIVNDDNRCYCLEANSLPGMTKTSLFPQMARAAGIGYDDLCQKIVDMAAKK